MTHTNHIVEQDAHHVMPTYGRFPLAAETGKGARLTDVDGKSYIDFTSGIGVNALGYCDENWVKAVTAQLNKVQHISNYYYSPVTTELADRLIELSGMKKVFFANSGAEANEAAIKIARKYSFDKYGEGRSTIITFASSFHGRTVTTLAATGQESFHNFFFPFTEGFKYAELNDAEGLLEALTPDVCAIFVEPIQGEGGVNIMTGEFALLLQKICEEKDILLLFDEVQTGIGRTGRLYAYEHFGFRPDVLTSAKGLGGGLPIGAVLCGEKTMDVLSAGTHGTTFGGNPVVAAGALEVLRRVADREFLSSVGEKGRYITEKILKMELPNVIQVRGRGLMIGIQVTDSPKELCKKCLEAGLLTLTAGKDVLRLLPPLTISHEEIDEGLAILEKVMKGQDNHAE